MPRTATGPNGEKVVLQNGQWVPLPSSLPPGREEAYRAWMNKIGHTREAGFAVTPDYTGENYDYRGYFKKYGAVDLGKDEHLTDEFKLPSHPTFSDESIYATGQDAQLAGHWEGEVYTPSPLRQRQDQQRSLATAQYSLSGNATDRPARLQAIRSGAGTFIANILGLPHAAGELLAAGAAVPRTAAGVAGAAVRGQPLNIGARFAAARQKEEESLPASALLRMPEPSGQDMLAAAGTIPRIPGVVRSDIERYRREGGQAPNPVNALGNAFDAATAAEAQRADEHPIATAAGRTAGDVATLFGLRPGANLAKLLKLPRSKPNVDQEIKSAVENAARVFGRGLGRTAEAGFEGALIGALGDADPVKTAAWTAGIQAGGSLALSAKNTLLRNPIKSFAALWIGHEMWKSIAPGPQQALESKDMAINELVAAFGLGTVAALAGAGRGVGSGSILKVTDAISTASRASVASVITQLQESRDNPQYSRIIGKMIEAPDYFGREARIRLERASRSEKPNAVIREIDNLMRSARFRKRYDEISD